MNAERQPERDGRPDLGEAETTPPEGPPARDETVPEQVPESEHPDVDDEGHMAPNRRTAEPDAAA
jgi:hypothetical protein